jgi:hypothetical protein
MGKLYVFRSEKKDPTCSDFRISHESPASGVIVEVHSTAFSLTYTPLGLGNQQSERILAYLAGAETREPLVWFKDDIRISWLTVLHCAEGVADPWRFAFWKYLGSIPEKVIPQLVARAEKHAAMEPLKKPSQSVTSPANQVRRTK